MKKEDNYLGAKIISFLFPIIGLIIYAVNIGKNDNIAKKCGKWALIGIFIVPATVLILYSIITVIPTLKDRTAGSEQKQVLVSDVQNMEINDAISELERIGLKVSKERKRVSSEDIEKDRVVKTDPSKGKLVDTNTEIIIYISSGSATVYMPDFTKGYAISEIESFCNEYGITLIKEYQETEIYEPGVIIKQSVAPNTVLRNGSRITITITKNK